MSRSTRILFGLVGIVAFACTSSTAPIAISRADLFNLQVPSSAAPGDSVHISFDYSPSGCRPLDHIETQSTAASVTFAVWLRPSVGVCTALAVRQTYAYVSLPNTRTAPFSAVFQQSAGPDSVRVVTLK
jgi:hypothetical protein